MKRKSIIPAIIGFIFTVLSSYGQNPSQFVDSTNQWYNSGNYSSSSGYYSGSQLILTDITLLVKKTYFYNGDTIIKGFNYKKLFLYQVDTMFKHTTNQLNDTTTNTMSSYVAAFRQDSLKVYIIENRDSIEHLYCDFNIKVGDTLNYYYKDGNVKIDSIGTIAFGTGIRKRYYLNNGLSFYEGIGCSLGLFHGFSFGIEGGEYLTCFMQDSIIQYVSEWKNQICGLCSTANQTICGSIRRPIPLAPKAEIYNQSCESTIAIREISATIGNTAANLFWYDSTSTTTSDSLKSIYHGNPLIITGLLPAGTYRYYVSQYLNGCQSTKTPVTFTIVPKPKLPVFDSAYSCFGSSYNAINVSGNNLGVIEWFNDSGNIVGNGITFTPSNLPVGDTYFKAIQLGVMALCSSDTVLVKYTVYPIPTIPIFDNPTVYRCETDTVLPTLHVKNISGKIMWSENGISILGSQYKPTASDDYITVVQEINGCISSPAQTKITTFAVALPTVSSDQSICGSENPKPFEASGSNIKWYSSPSNFKTGSTFLPSKFTIPLNGGDSVVNTYYVSQTVMAPDSLLCESGLVTTKLTVKAIPLTPTLDKVLQTMCDTSTIIPCFTVTNALSTESIVWQDSTAATISSGLSFTPTQSNFKVPSNIVFTVTKFDNGCYSKSIQALLEVEKCSNITPISINTSSSEIFSLYPNPTTSYFTINTDKEVLIIIYSMSGTIVLKTNCNRNETIPISNLPNGLYIVKIVSANSVDTRSIIVDKN